MYHIRRKDRKDDKSALVVSKNEDDDLNVDEVSPLSHYLRDLAIRGTYIPND